MKLRLRDEVVPYPLFTLKGRLRLSGLSDHHISEVLTESMVEKAETEKTLIDSLRESLTSYKSTILTNFETLTKYEHLRGRSLNVPSIVLVIEGASATGKSMLALELMRDLTATRFISTDTVRQVLRGMMSEDQHPELFCHTYQAYLHRQVGTKNLKPVVRGFLAQCEIISPHILSLTKRVLTEGAITVIEGVHIEPGSLQELSTGVIEVLINPSSETHTAMFESKHNLGKLKTVSEDMNVRRKEFEATRAIQDYMITKAKETDVSIVELVEYDDTRKSISTLIISHVNRLLRALEEGGGKQ